MQLVLDRFLQKDEELIDLDKITIKDALSMLKEGSFSRYFDRSRIIGYLKHIAQDIKKYCGREFCPRCGSTDVKVVPGYEGVKQYFECRVCGKRFVHPSVVGTHFRDWVIIELTEGIYSGKFMSKVAEDIERQLDENTRDKIPDEKTLYDLLDRVAEFLKDFDAFLVLLVGGLNCSRIMCDDAFSRRRRRRKKYRQKSLDGNIVFLKGKSKRRRRYYYTIVILDPDLRYILVSYASEKRDKKAFCIAFATAMEKMRSLPETVKGDKLKAMMQAAELYFPKSKVRHEFEKLSWYEKEELNKIENRIRKLRETIRKRRKYGSIRVLRNYLTIAVIGTNYLERMKVLGNRAPAEVAGIPYPTPGRKKWYYFLEYARIVRTMLPQILKIGLKAIPGTPLKPIVSAQFINQQASLRDEENYSH